MERKDNKLSKILVLAFMGFTLIGMTFSFVFYGFNDGNAKANYKGFKFKLDRQNSVWVAKINGAYAGFSFLPNEVEDINISASLENLKNKFEIDTTSDMNDTNIEAIALAQHQMGITMQNYNIYIRQGMAAANKYNISIINCSMATPAVPVVYFKTGNKTQILQDGDCIIAEARNGQDTIRAKDRIVYSILGVME